MTKQEAPEVEPAKKPVESRGRFIDFAPKRAKRAPVPEPVEELDASLLDDFVDPEFAEEPDFSEEFPDEIAPEIPDEPVVVKRSKFIKKDSKKEKEPVEELTDEDFEEKPAEKPARSSADSSDSSEDSSDSSEESSESPEEPVKRVRKPLINTSGIFDFIRPKASRKAPEAVVEHISAEGQVEDPDSGEIANVSVKSTKLTSATTTAVSTSISASTPRISRHLTVADVIRPKRAPKRPQITAEEIADFAVESKPEEPVTTLEEISEFSENTENNDLPPMDEDDLAVALAGFADEPDSPGLSAPVPTDDLSREAADFAEEINALDELSSGDGDEIDNELAKALETETKEFVSEPKPLFEKRKEERPVKKEEPAREPIENEHVMDQDFASGRGINYDPLVKDAERAEEEARKRAEEKEKARIAKAKAEAPDGNMYTLGGRSPFLTSVHVEKRPLSQYVPSNMTSLETMANTPVKNTYRAKIKKALEDDAKEIHRQTLIVSAPIDSKTRSTALIFAVILTVLLGAGVGAIVYLVFFQ